jgi:predicted flap endonuclease-1-like 5' DNA nuclease
MIINSKEWVLINQEKRMNKGKLINVELSRGRYVKMYEADAIAQGLIKPTRIAAVRQSHEPPAAAKARTPEANKMRKAPANKTGQRIETDQRMAIEPQAAIAEIAKLLTEERSKVEDEAPPPVEQPGPESIPGIGKASARALAAHGVITLDALKEAQDLDYLPAKVLAAIAEWRLVACDQTERG